MSEEKICRDCGKPSMQNLCNDCALQHSHDYNDANICEPMCEVPLRRIEELRSDRASLLAVARAAKALSDYFGDDFPVTCKPVRKALAALSDEVKREMEKS